jgi:hypothetical protein
LRSHRSLIVTALAVGAVAAAGSAHAATSAPPAFGRGSFEGPVLAAAPLHADVSPQWTQSTNGAYSFTVPAGVNTIVASLTGGGGGGGGSQVHEGGSGGGGGATVSCTLAVSPGETLNIYVGGGNTGGDVDKNGAPGSPSYISGGTYGYNRTYAAAGQGGWGGIDGGYGGAGGGTDGFSCLPPATQPVFSNGNGGGNGGTGFFDWHGGSGGAPGSPLPATCPANAGHGGDGAAGGAFTGYPGNNGIDGCVVLSY